MRVESNRKFQNLLMKIGMCKKCWWNL